MDTYFNENQRELLKLANTEAGRSLLNIKDDFKIVKLTPNSYHQLVGFNGKKPVLRATFFSEERVAEKIGIPYEMMDLSHTGFKPITDMYHAFLHYTNIKRSKYPLYANVALASSTFNPNTGEKTGRVTAQATWAGARGASSSGDGQAVTEVGSLIAGTYNNYRVFQPFNTSSLGSGSTVTASNYQFYRDDALEFGGNGFNNVDTTTANVVVSTEADPTAYAATDYSLVSFTSKGSINFASTTNGAYNTITITDQTIISTTANTKLAILTGLDISNTAPTGLNTLAFRNRASANPPILTVTYTPAPSGGSFLLNFV